MGLMSALDMIEQSGSRKTALLWHLSYNCYPPVNLVFLESAEKAMDAILEDDGSMLIELPNGRVLTAYDVCRQLHLDAFLSYDEGEE